MIGVEANKEYALMVIEVSLWLPTNTDKNLIDHVFSTLDLNLR